MVTKFFITQDDTGLVTATGYGEIVPEGFTEVDRDTFSKVGGKAHLVRWKDGKATPVEEKVDPNRPYELTKLTILDRMTDAQLDTFYAELEKQPKRFSKSFDVAQSINSKHPLFAMLHGAMTAKWGKAEADRILAKPA